MTEEHQREGVFAPDIPTGHPGELEMRARLPSKYKWTEQTIGGMIRPYISVSLGRFVEGLPFFFIATSNKEGHCDASFRGREYDASGNALPALRVINQARLIFPDFSGNGLYNSLGNITVNPHIGMLFMDFHGQQRARINGVAKIVHADQEIRSVWPSAQAAVVVSVEQVYGNCQARIPKMAYVEGSDQDF